MTEERSEVQPSTASVVTVQMCLAGHARVNLPVLEKGETQSKYRLQLNAPICLLQSTLSQSKWSRQEVQLQAFEN